MKKSDASKFLVGPALTAEIMSILAEDGASAAVAFWGRGAKEWATGLNQRIIVNLRMGGTNPCALKEVAASLKQCDRLHAKVYIGSTRAVVSSANVSVNGLALEGLESASWIEAGVLTTEIDEIVAWFEDFWNKKSRKITSGDWEVARLAWRNRSRLRPALTSFADFDPAADHLPLLTWINDDRWTINEEVLDQNSPTSKAIIRDRIDRGLGIREVADEELVKDRWILCWSPGARRGTIKGYLWFTQTSDLIIRDGFATDSDGIVYNAVLATEKPSDEPFKVEDKVFLLAFKKVLKLPKYSSFHDDEVEGKPWFADRETLTRTFWFDVKEAYKLQSAARSPE